MELPFAEIKRAEKEAFLKGGIKRAVRRPSSQRWSLETGVWPKG
jgi:hypothetical protein